LVTVAAVRRLHPRHWDGHRLLQFLTGLALLALAFGTTAASAAPVSPPATTVTTTVEAPAPGTDDAATPVRTSRDSDECQHDASRAAHAAPSAPAAGPAPAAANAAPVVAHAADAAPVVAHAADAAPAAAPAAAAAPAGAPRAGADVEPAVAPRPATVRLAGIAAQAHGSRAPPH
jgi:hypothetical protein